MCSCYQTNFWLPSSADLNKLIVSSSLHVVELLRLAAFDILPPDTCSASCSCRCKRTSRARREKSLVNVRKKRRKARPTHHSAIVLTMCDLKPYPQQAHQQLKKKSSNKTHTSSNHQIIKQNYITFTTLAKVNTDCKLFKNKKT